MTYAELTETERLHRLLRNAAELADRLPNSSEMGRILSGLATDVETKLKREAGGGQHGKDAHNPAGE